MVHAPPLTSVNTPPAAMVQTAAVDDVRATASPDEAVAVNVGEAPNVSLPGLANVIVWLVPAVVEFDAADATLVPTELAAVTVNVYAVPIVNPVTVSGRDAPV